MTREGHFLNDGLQPLLGFPSTLFPLFLGQNSYSRDREGTKTGGAPLALLLHHSREKTHIPGNLPLPASSLSTPPRLVSSYLTGCGATLSWRMVIKERKGKERIGKETGGDLVLNMNRLRERLTSARNVSTEKTETANTQGTKLGGSWVACATSLCLHVR